MLNNLKLSFTPKISYITNIQSHKGKANIFYKIENENIYDKEAIAIYTLNRAKEEIFLGYLTKRTCEVIYTNKANDLYYMANSGEMTWEEAKNSNHWAEIKEKIFTDIYTKEQLEEILLNIESKKYKFIYCYQSENGFLFK